MERIHPRVRILWLLRGVFPSLFLGAVAIGVTAVLSSNPLGNISEALPVGGAVALLVFGLGVVHTLFRYRAFGYEVQDDALYIERGVLTKVNTVVPYVRVQHIDTQRNPFERVFGLGHVVVYTAGSRGADVSVPGLLPGQATDLQQRLRTLAGESEPDDAV
ncbi:PH domain-containing protein [Haloarculaceae archaeon H-GB2-1]|nr:PH domain-containing protein [Haloarculaceae archaeon H-GB1-1]MEA5387181.1 PH domain-containing protein [Haloarculaceae archaeon H-GB11]MEA5408674.1 PH domain-containing protein [Haloarculaceae archaeon H-GB2-1]